MNDRVEHSRAAHSLPKAKIKRSHQTWWLWLVPIGAVLLCVWFIYRDYIATGPMITIYFQDASGLEENNSDVHYLGATVGQVKGLWLTSDNKRVEVKARLAHSAAQLARVGTLFWIVRPELKVGSISGLRTIISGEYIAVRPGNGPATNVFTAVESEPVVEPPGSLHITLLAPDLRSLQEQSVIYYRGIKVGEISKYQLGNDAQEVKLQARIDPEYAPLVRANTKFWNAGGLDFRFGLFRGAEISAESAKALLSGGVEFATPTEAGAPAAEGAVFRLYDKPEDAWKDWAPAIKLNLPQQAPENPQPTNLGGLK
ncbi:MAG TPA: MlaD family protein [Candidatus Angelobacter sp.]|nr:MlaD family protein [Candidatus Angelobacter sp.]